MALIFLINIISVKSFGETEYWLSLIKVVTVFVFLIVGLLTIMGIMGGHGPIGFKNYTTGAAPFVVVSPQLWLFLSSRVFLFREPS